MFVLWKILKALLLPPSLVVLALVVGVACIVWRRRRWGIMVLITASVGYYLLAIEPTGALLAWSLERSSSVVTPQELRGVEAIVILAGGATKSPREELGGASWRRLWRGIELSRDLGDVPVIYAGGSGDPFDVVSHEAALARRYAMMIGVSGDQFWIEEQSRDTFENAVRVGALLRERFPEHERHRIALVTSAWHIPRAVGTFVRVGMDVVPIPADYLSGSFSWDLLSFVPSLAAFQTSNMALHEWFGLFAYRLRGRL